MVEWQGNDHTYGSRHYVEAAKRDGSLASLKAMVLVDMIARPRSADQARHQLDAVADRHHLGRGATRRSSTHYFAGRADADRRRPPAVPPGRRPVGGHHRPRLPRLAHGRRHARRRQRPQPADRRRRAARGASADRSAAAGSSSPRRLRCCSCQDWVGQFQKVPNRFFSAVLTQDPTAVDPTINGTLTRPSPTVRCWQLPCTADGALEASGGTVALRADTARHIITAVTVLVFSAAAIGTAMRYQDRTGPIQMPLNADLPAREAIPASPSAAPAPAGYIDATRGSGADIAAKLDGTVALGGATAWPYREGGGCCGR